MSRNNTPKPATMSFHSQREKELIQALVDSVSDKAHHFGAAMASVGCHYGVNYNRRVGEEVERLNLSPDLAAEVRNQAWGRLH